MIITGISGIAKSDTDDVRDMRRTKTNGGGSARSRFVGAGEAVDRGGVLGAYYCWSGCDPGMLPGDSAIYEHSGERRDGESDE